MEILTMNDLADNLEIMQMLFGISVDETNSENVSDWAYDAAWNIARTVANELVKATAGKIDIMTASRMVIHKSDKLMNLCRRCPSATVSELNKLAVRMK